MGIQTNQPYNTKFGITIPSAYISLRYETLVTKSYDSPDGQFRMYSLEGNYRVYNNKTALEPFEVIFFSHPLNTSELSDSVYTIAYNYIKQLYPESTDDI
jgi:hypothetical protein